MLGWETGLASQPNKRCAPAAGEHDDALRCRCGATLRRIRRRRHLLRPREAPRPHAALPRRRRRVPPLRLLLQWTIELSISPVDITIANFSNGSDTSPRWVSGVGPWEENGLRMSWRNCHKDEHPCVGLGCQMGETFLREHARVLAVGENGKLTRPMQLPALLRLEHKDHLQLQQPLQPVAVAQPSHMDEYLMLCPTPIPEY